MQRIVQCDIRFSSSLCIFFSGPTYTPDHTLESRYVKSKIKFKKKIRFSVEIRTHQFHRLMTKYCFR